MRVTGLDIVVSAVTLLAIAVMIPMPWLLSPFREAGGHVQCRGAFVALLSPLSADYCYDCRGTVSMTEYVGVILCEACTRLPETCPQCSRGIITTTRPRNGRTVMASDEVLR